MNLIMWYKPALIFRVEEFQQPAPFRWWDMIENEIYGFRSPNVNALSVNKIDVLENILMY